MYITFEKKYIFKVSIIFFFIFPTILLSQIFPKESYEIGSLIPENYKLKNLQMGDLNGDNQDDLVLIIRNLETKKKSIAIYYFDLELKTWKLKSQSENFFDYINGDIFRTTSSRFQNADDKIAYEEFASIEIKNKIIIIGTHDGYGNSIYTSLRLNKVDKYKIIGIDINSYPRNHLYNISINYLTSKMKTTMTMFSALDNGGDLIEEEWFKILNLQKYNFIGFSIKEFYKDKSKFNKKRIIN